MYFEDPANVPLWDVQVRFAEWPSHTLHGHRCVLAGVFGFFRQVFEVDPTCREVCLPSKAPGSPAELDAMLLHLYPECLLAPGARDRRGAACGLGNGWLVTLMDSPLIEYLDVGAEDRRWDAMNQVRDACRCCGIAGAMRTPALSVDFCRRCVVRRWVTHLPTDDSWWADMLGLRLLDDSGTRAVAAALRAATDAAADVAAAEHEADSSGCAAARRVLADLVREDLVLGVDAANELAESLPQACCSCVYLAVAVCCARPWAYRGPEYLDVLCHCGDYNLGGRGMLPAVSGARALEVIQEKRQSVEHADGTGQACMYS